MSYLATILNKHIHEGMLKVQVAFTSTTSADHYIQEFVTNQYQSDSWLIDLIQDRLKHLNKLESLLDTIEVGAEFTEQSSTNTVNSSNYQQYSESLMKFNKMVSAIHKGILTKNNPDFQSLKSELNANFSIEYIDLF